MLATTTRTTTLFQLPTLFYMIQKIDINREIYSYVQIQIGAVDLMVIGIGRQLTFNASVE